MKITSQQTIRALFWEDDAERKRRFWHPTYTQNQYTTDVHVSWVDFVDNMSRSGQISNALASRATL